MVAILLERGSYDILQLIDGSYALFFNRVILSWITLGEVQRRMGWLLRRFQPKGR